MRELGKALAVFVAVLVLSGCASTPESGMTQAEREKAASTNTQLGMRYLQQDELQRSLTKLEKALRQDPDNAEAHMVMGILQERLDQPDKAEEHFQRAHELSPKDPSLLNNYGRFLCSRGEYEKAVEYFKQAGSNALYKNRALAWTNAGVCALNNDKRDKAETYLLRALKHNPEFSSALFRMAQLRYEAEHYMSARGFYQRYLAVAEQTPRSLWLGIRIEDALGDEDAVASYSLLLKQKYPDSEQTKKLLEWQANEG